MKLWNRISNPPLSRPGFSKGVIIFARADVVSIEIELITAKYVRKSQFLDRSFLIILDIVGPGSWLEEDVAPEFVVVYLSLSFPPLAYMNVLARRVIFC